MKKNLLSILTLGLILTSCDGADKSAENTEQVEQKKVIKNCLYSYNETQSELTFTAYKFIRKAGVGGTFTKIQVEGPETAADPKSLVEQLSFKIPSSSVETNDPGRNKKIDSLFFGTLVESEFITGKVLKLGEDNKATIEITMNTVSKEVEGTYALEGNVFSFDTEIDVNNWNAHDGITALNEACKDLHTDVQNGDTESKLWPDVTISFKTTLREVCD